MDARARQGPMEMRRKVKVLEMGIRDALPRSSHTLKVLSFGEVGNGSEDCECTHYESLIVTAQFGLNGIIVAQDKRWKSHELSLIRR